MLPKNKELLKEQNQVDGYIQLPVNFTVIF